MMSTQRYILSMFISFIKEYARKLISSSDLNINPLFDVVEQISHQDPALYQDWVDMVNHIL